MPDDISGVRGAYDPTEIPVVECPACEDGYRYNSPLASRRGLCPLCAGEGWVQAGPDSTWDGGWERG